MTWKVKLDQRKMISSQGGNADPLMPMSYKQKAAGRRLPNCARPQELVTRTRNVQEKTGILARTQKAVAKLPTSLSVGEKVPLLFQINRK